MPQCKCDFFIFFFLFEGASVAAQARDDITVQVSHSLSLSSKPLRRVRQSSLPRAKILNAMGRFLKDHGGF